MSYTPEGAKELAQAIYRGETMLSMPTQIELLSAHAALLEQYAKLRKHAEAMAWVLGEDSVTVQRFRADFPKEEPKDSNLYRILMAAIPKEPR